MTVRSFGDARPKVAPTAWVSEAAYVIGDVDIGDGSSVWPGAVVRGDFAPIRIGANTHVEDNCVLHCGEELTLGDDITLGHGVVVHCRSIGDNCLIGNGAILLDGAEIGDHSIVGAGALVLARTTIPPRSFAIGHPVEIREASSERVARLEARGSRDGGYARMVQRYRELGL